MAAKKLISAQESSELLNTLKKRFEKIRTAMKNWIGQKLRRNSIQTPQNYGRSTKWKFPVENLML